MLPLVEASYSSATDYIKPKRHPPQAQDDDEPRRKQGVIASKDKAKGSKGTRGEAKGKLRKPASNGKRTRKHSQKKAGKDATPANLLPTAPESLEVDDPLPPVSTPTPTLLPPPVASSAPSTIPPTTIPPPTLLNMVLPSPLPATNQPLAPSAPSDLAAYPLERRKRRKLVAQMTNTMASQAISQQTLPPLKLPRSCTLVPSDEVARARPSAKLMDLPMEIIERIHMYSRSEALPVVNKDLQYQLSNVNHKARWVMYDRCPSKDLICNTHKGASPLDHILTRRFCNKEVLLQVLEIWEKRLRAYERQEREEQLNEWERQQERRRWSGHELGDDPPSAPPPRPSPRATKIPRRLLRTVPGAQPRLDPYVRFLARQFEISPDADLCYPLKRGAADGNYELVQWLLERGAKVTTNEHVAFKAAIANKDLKMMKLLIEPEDFKFDKKGEAVTDPSGDPIPKVDRMQCPREWVDLALRSEAYEIVHWLVDEKGLTPSLNRIMSLEVAGYHSPELNSLKAKAPRPKAKTRMKTEKQKEKVKKKENGAAGPSTST